MHSGNRCKQKSKRWLGYCGGGRLLKKAANEAAGETKPEA